jgi:hypothetical protein
MLKLGERAALGARCGGGNLLPSSPRVARMSIDSDASSKPLAGLLAAARERMRTRHLALRTEQAYLQWLQRYVEFHGGRDPRALGAGGVEQFLTHLAVHRKVGAATQNQAL